MTAQLSDTGRVWRARHVDIAQGKCRLGFHLGVSPGHLGNYTSLQAGHLAKDKEWVFQGPLSQQSRGGQQGSSSSEAGHGCTCPWLEGQQPPWTATPGLQILRASKGTPTPGVTQFLGQAHQGEGAL